jgi:hypothetical protein
MKIVFVQYKIKMALVFQIDHENLWAKNKDFKFYEVFQYLTLN